MNSFQKIVFLSGASVAAVVAVGIFLLLRKRNRDFDEGEDGEELDFADLNANEDSVASAGQSISKVHVPVHMVGSFIGRDGSNIKKLRAEFGVRFNFERDHASEKKLVNSKSSEKVTHRLLEIRGQRDKVRAAEQKVNAIIAESPKYIETEILVPQEVCGRIIGKGGQSIREACSISGAKIVIDRNEDKVLGNQRKVHFSGTTVQVEYAKLLINEKVEQYKASKSKHQSKESSNATYQDGKHCNFPSISLPNSSEYFQVFVSAIDSPNQFWVQVVSKDSTKLDQLTSEISEIYGSLLLHEERLESGNAGDICVASYDDDNLWYRASIIRFKQDRTAELFYFDFGDTGCVELDRLKRIRPEHKELFAQAIYCYLPIKPAGETWTDEAKEEFINLTHCSQWIPIMAKIIYKQTSEHREIPVLHLVDTSQDEDIDIANTMILKGHAVNLIEENDVNDVFTSNSADTLHSFALSKESAGIAKELVNEEDVFVAEVTNQNSESELFLFEEMKKSRLMEESEINPDVTSKFNIDCTEKMDTGSTNDFNKPKRTINEDVSLPSTQQRLYEDSNSDFSQNNNNLEIVSNDSLIINSRCDEEIFQEESSDLPSVLIVSNTLSESTEKADIDEKICTVAVANTENFNQLDTIEWRDEKNGGSSDLSPVTCLNLSEDEQITELKSSELKENHGDTDNTKLVENHDVLYSNVALKGERVNQIENSYSSRESYLSDEGVGSLQEKIHGDSLYKSMSALEKKDTEELLNVGSIETNETSDDFSLNHLSVGYPDINLKNEINVTQSNTIVPAFNVSNIEENLVGVISVADILADNEKCDVSNKIVLEGEIDCSGSKNVSEPYTEFYSDEKNNLIEQKGEHLEKNQSLQLKKVCEEAIDNYASAQEHMVDGVEKNFNDSNLKDRGDDVDEIESRDALSYNENVKLETVQLQSDNGSMNNGTTSEAAIAANENVLFDTAPVKIDSETMIDEIEHEVLSAESEQFSDDTLSVNNDSEITVCGTTSEVGLITSEMSSLDPSNDDETMINETESESTKIASESTSLDTASIISGVEAMLEETFSEAGNVTGEIAYLDTVLVKGDKETVLSETVSECKNIMNGSTTFDTSRIQTDTAPMISEIISEVANVTSKMALSDSTLIKPNSEAMITSAKDATIASGIDSSYVAPENFVSETMECGSESKVATVTNEIHSALIPQIDHVSETAFNASASGSDASEIDISETTVTAHNIDDKSLPEEKPGDTVSSMEMVNSEEPLNHDKYKEITEVGTNVLSEDSDDDFVDINVKNVNGTLTAFVSEQNLHITSDDHRRIASDDIVDDANDDELQKSLEKTSRKNVVRRTSMELARENLMSLSANYESDTDSFFSARSDITITDTETDYYTLDDRVTSPSSLSDRTFYSTVSKSSLYGSKQSLNAPLQRRSLSGSFEISHIDERSEKVLSVEHILTSPERNGKVGGIGKQTTV